MPNGIRRGRHCKPDFPVVRKGAKIQMIDHNQRTNHFFINNDNHVVID